MNILSLVMINIYSLLYLLLQPNALISTQEELVHSGYEKETFFGKIYVLLYYEEPV
jgi:hypothetical protein